MPSRNHLDKIGRKKKKKWTEEAMERALVEVKSGRCTVRQAAKEFGVPKSSLGDRVSGRVTPGSRSGPAQLITSADEELLVEFSSYMSKHGFPLTKQQLVSFASSIYKRQHRRVAFSKLGQTWWLNFRKRQEKNISIQPADGVVRGRTICVRQEAVDQFFLLLSSVMDAHGLRDKPRQILNCNETAFHLGRKRVIGPKSAAPGCKATSFKDNISVLVCFSAAGEDVPPFIIYSKAYPGGVCYKTRGPADALYGWSDSGFLTADLFKKWFLRHFLVYAPKERPLLLIFDGHKSPVNLEVVEAARKQDVVLLCLPPHCSQILQPLNMGLFALLKQRFAALVGDGRANDAAHFAVSKKEFSGAFKRTYQAAKEEEGVGIVKESFRKCGIFPLNRCAVNGTHLMPSRNVDPASGPAGPTSDPSDAGPSS